MTISSRHDDIVKSEKDDCGYRGLVLENGLKVLLVSDPTTDKSSAAMDVHVGHMSDPVELPGLAHFCEHMLFMGTKTYPDENEYSKYLTDNGGGSNAYTSSCNTNYYFDVTPPHFEGALDRFSRFFIEPLFAQSATDREMKAVNSEHEKNIPSDPWRINQVEHFLSDPGHDYYKFGTGNLDTLKTIPEDKGIDVREALLKFHEKYYSSNIMALTVLDKTSLDDLEALVVKLFQGVQNKNIDVPSWENHPYQETSRGTKVYITPIKDSRQLKLTFPIPDVQVHYKAQPACFLSHLIGHEGKGSLLSELKNRGLVNSLWSGPSGRTKGFGFFSISMDMTPTGVKSIDDIIDIVFQYLSMLRKEGPKEWIFEEQKKLQEMQFRFKDKQRPQGRASQLANSLHDYAFEDVLSGAYLLEEWKPDLITLILDKLVPEEARIFVVGQDFESFCTDEEPWYKTKIKLSKIPEGLIKSWSNPESVCDKLKLPTPNELIASNFDLVERDPDNGEQPTILKDTKLGRVWYRQDDEFQRPKCNLYFSIQSPVAYASPHNINLIRMFVSLFKDHMTEYTYDADLASLFYSIANSQTGLTMSISGYNEKQHVLLDKLMTELVTFEVDKVRFVQLKDAYARGLKNFNMEQPTSHAIYHNDVLLSSAAWTKEELIEELDELTPEAVQAFIPLLLSNVYIEALFHGNLTQARALELMDIVESKLADTNGGKRAPSKRMRKSQRLVLREVQLTPDSSCVFLSETKVHKSSCIEIYFQCGPRSTKTDLYLKMLSQILSEPAFDQLRTKEQLGYVVWCGMRRKASVQGLRVLIMSDKHPSYLDERIELFLETMEKNMEELSEEAYEKHRSAVKANILEKPKKLSSRTSKYWTEIANGYYHFNRDQIEAQELDSVSKEDVLAFFKQHISAGSKERRKMSCHVISKTEDGAGTVDDRPIPQGALEIKDSNEFKECRGLHPKLLPFVPTSSLRNKNYTSER